jgi:hypothetical protein
VKPGDGCTLEHVVTEGSRMKIEWKKDGHVEEAILIMPASCAGVKEPHGGMTALVPGSVDAACPAAAALTREVVGAGATGELVEVGGGIHDADPSSASGGSIAGQIPLSPTQILLTALTVVLVAALATSARRARSPAEPRKLWALAGLAALAMAARIIAARPTFLHANLHGTALLDEIFAFPRPATFRAMYGQYSFFVLGAAARLFGRSFEVIVAVNQVVAALSLGLSALLARRLAGAWIAAWTTLACGALLVPVVRVAASEDAHNLAVLLGLTGVLCLDAYAVGRRRALLVAGTAALLLMINTRQTLYVMAPCAFLMAWARGGRALIRDPALLAAGAVVLAGLVLRTRVTVNDGAESISLVMIGIVLTTRSAILPLFAHHPLLDVARFGPAVPALLAAGLWACARRRGALGGLGLAFVAVFVVTLPFGFPTPGVEYSFRSPVLALGLVVAGVGGAVVADALRARFGARSEALALGAAGGLAGLGFALPGRSDLSRVSPEYAEYRFVQAAALELPRALTWLELPHDAAQPGYRAPSGALARAGYRISEASSLAAAKASPGPVYFLAGVQCRAWSVVELLGGLDPHRRDAQRSFVTRLAPVLFDRAPIASVASARGVRPECLEITARGVPVGPRGVVPAPVSDIPFVVYTPEDLPLQFYRLDL